MDGLQPSAVAAEPFHSEHVASPPQGRRIVIIGPSGRAISRLRGALIRDVLSRGHSVLALAPQMSSQDAQSLIALGAEAASFALKPEKFSLWPGRVVVRALAEQLKVWRADAVLIFGQSIVPLAGRAARIAKTKTTVLMVSELSGGAVSGALARAIKSADKVVSHNRDDHRALSASAAAGGEHKFLRVAGAGADLAGMAALPLPDFDNGVVFLMAARLDKEKGARDFCEAATIARNEGLNARFLLAGPDGTGDGALAPQDLSVFAGSVECLGDAADIRAVLQRAHVFVAPSYVEGMPHAVQQAMAAGRPVIVSDVAGSRETADEFVNGIVVPPRNIAALAGAFRRMVKSKELIAAMGRASRVKAERNFDVAAVNRDLRAALGLA